VELLLAIWPTGTATGQTVALVETNTGKVLVQGSLPAGVDITRAPVVRQVSGAQAAVGPVVVDAYAKRLDVLDSAYTVAALVKGHVYATLTGRTVDIGLTDTGKFPVTYFTATQTIVPLATATVGGATVALALVPTAAGKDLLGFAAA
jgi:hypothetical protein